jgi:hypothetical protein
MDVQANGAIWSMWVTPSSAEPRICSTCWFGAPYITDAELVRAILGEGRAELIAEAQIHLGAGRTPATVAISIARRAWANPALFEALRLHRVDCDSLMAGVEQIAAEVVAEASKRALFQ